tara:strand:- start:219 stop:434 length:216 start_codon:yes stop_codon:yes gene_type:complete
MANLSERNVNVATFVTMVRTMIMLPKNERTKTGTQKDHSTMMETSMDLIEYPEYDDCYEFDVENDCVFEYE